MRTLTKFTLMSAATSLMIGVAMALQPAASVDGLHIMAQFAPIQAAHAADGPRRFGNAVPKPEISASETRKPQGHLAVAILMGQDDLPRIATR